MEPPLRHSTSFPVRERRLVTIRLLFQATYLSLPVTDCRLVAPRTWARLTRISVTQPANIRSALAAPMFISRTTAFLAPTRQRSKVSEIKVATQTHSVTLYRGRCDNFTEQSIRKGN